MNSGAVFAVVGLSVWHDGGVHRCAVWEYDERVFSSKSPHFVRNFGIEFVESEFVFLDDGPSVPLSPRERPKV